MKIGKSVKYVEATFDDVETCIERLDRKLLRLNSRFDEARAANEVYYALYLRDKVEETNWERSAFLALKDAIQTAFPKTLELEPYHIRVVRDGQRIEEIIVAQARYSPAQETLVSKLCPRGVMNS